MYLSSVFEPGEARTQLGASRNCARLGRGERGSSRFLVPVPDPREVMRVRRRMQIALDRLASHRSAPGP